MTNPKVLVKQNTQGQWYFAVVGRNGKTILIGGETFKNKPSKKKLGSVNNVFAKALNLQKIEYKSRKK